MLRNLGTGLVALCMAAGMTMVGCGDDDSGATCGDGVIGGSEVCDGSQLGGGTCTAEGFTGGTISCNATCDGYDTTTCTNDSCGDGQVTGMEDCDGADLDGETCETLNFDGGSLACSMCAFDTSACFDNCGDGTIQVGDEVCDGADLDNMDCTDEGFDAGTLACATDCASFDTMGCCNDNCPAEDDSQCTGDTLNTCTLAANGCLDWVDTDCTANGDVCGGTPSTCQPACTDECATDGETRCQPGSLLTLCSDSDSDGCLDITTTDCAATGEICDDTGTPACVAQGTGESCLDATAVQQPGLTTFQFDTTGRVDDYGVDVAIDYTACGGSGGFGPDIVFAVTVPAGDVLDATVTNQTFTAALILSPDCADIEGTCVSYQEGSTADLTGSWANNTGATFTVFVVVDSGFSGSVQEGTGDLTINVRTPICGDGIVDEACDDGNTANGDGCDSTCAVEATYVCSGTPSVCYVPAPGDTCVGPTVITPPDAFTLDTTPFIDDYGVEVGSDYTACGGSGGFGPDVVYSVDVPDGDYLSVTGDNASFTALLVLSTDCADIEGTCTSADEGNNALTGAYLNTSGALQTVFVVVDSGFSFSAQQGTIDLTFSLSTPACGNGTTEPGEQCDDGNTTAGDGCSPTCTVEFLPPEFIIGCDPTFCVMTAGGGPNGGDLYTFTIPAASHPQQDMLEASCFGAGAAPELIINLDSTGYTNFTATTCTTTPDDSSLAVFDANPLGASTEVACDEDASGETAFCSEITDSGGAGPGTPTATPASNDMWFVVDEWNVGDYWDGVTDRVIEFELIP